MSKFWQFLAWAKAVKIEIKRSDDDVSADDIRYSVIKNARDQRDLYRERQNLPYDDEGCDWEPVDEDRSVVAFLRHNATNYDELLAEMKARHYDLEWFDESQVDPTDDEIDAYQDAYRKAYNTIRQRIHEALMEAFPDFAEAIRLADVP